MAGLGRKRFRTERRLGRPMKGDESGKPLTSLIRSVVYSWIVLCRVKWVHVHSERDLPVRFFFRHLFQRVSHESSGRGAVFEFEQEMIAVPFWRRWSP